MKRQLFNRIQFWRNFLLSSLVIMFLTLAAPFAIAQQSQYDGLDIVFVVDQSGSMGGIPGVEPSDPFGLRFESPWYATYWLGEDRLLVHPNVDYRIAVVQFGTNAETWNFGTSANPVYWQEIAPDTRDGWQPVYDALANDLRSEMPATYQRNLGLTDILKGMQRAEDLFAALPEPAGERQRVIVLLTDGDPVRDSRFIQDDDEKISLMQEIEAFSVSAFPEPDYRIYVVGMNSGVNYWRLTGPYWERITNDPCTNESCPEPELDRAGLIASNDDVGKRFQEILQDLTGALPTPEGVNVIDQQVIPGALAVPPYLESISFTYFKTDPVEQLVLTDPVGDVDLNRPGTTIEGQGGPIEVVRIASPEPGQWFVATDPPGPDVDITMRQIFAQSRLDTPRGVQGQYIPLTVQYALLNEVGGPLPSYADPRFRLMVEAQIEAGGQTWPIMLTDQGNNIYQAEFVPLVTGQHTIFVYAASQDLDGNPVIVFDGEIGEFAVSPANLVALNVPTQVQQYDQAAFVFELQDARGFPLPSSTPLEAEINIEGAETTTIALTAQPDGTYLGTFSPQVAGNYSAAVVAKITDPINGNEYTVANEPVGQFAVSPTVRIGLSLVLPQETQQNSTGLWPLDRTPLIVEVELRDENGQLVDPQAVFVDPDQAVSLGLSDEDGDDLSASLSLQPTARPGVYHAETTELGRGKFTIDVAMGGDLQQGYLYGPDVHASRVVSRVIHPWHLPIAGGSLLALLLLLATGMVVAAARRRVRIHPCTGRIVLVDHSSVPLFQRSLDGYGRNRLVFTSKDIQNPMTHVTKIVLTCPSQQAYDSKQVQVEVYLDKNQTPLSRPMGPGAELKLNQYNFWLLKDPTEDQMLQDRGVGDFGDESWDTGAAWSDNSNPATNWTGGSESSSWGSGSPWESGGGNQPPTPTKDADDPWKWSK